MACNTSFWSYASLRVEIWTLFPQIITQDTLGIKPPGGITAPTISANLSNTKFALYGGDWSSHLVDLRDHIVKIREAVRNGELGETGRFWIKYMDCIFAIFVVVFLILFPNL